MNRLIAIALLSLLTLAACEGASSPLSVEERAGDLQPSQECGGTDVRPC